MRRPTIPLTAPRPAVVVTGLVFALAGLMFAAAATTSQGTDLRAQRALELRDLVRQESVQVRGIEQTVAARQRSVDDLLAGRTGDPAAVLARSGIEALQDDAGLTPVTGRALTVTLDDAPLREPDDPLWQTLTPDDVIVHQADVQAVVNALWRGGAEALQVMDQRVINTSSIQCVGNTLLLQGRVYSPPFTITAVGPIKKMRGSLRRDPAVREYRQWAAAVGLGYSAARSPELTIPGFDGPIAMEYAAPATSAAVQPVSDPAAEAAPSLPSE
jgi:uncharacterized protein YlxW (UPF0749 family)